MRFLGVIVLVFVVFFSGYKTAEDVGLEKCKEAGWEFIEEVVFSKSDVKDSVLYTKEQNLNRLKNLQSNIATKCILRFK